MLLSDGFDYELKDFCDIKPHSVHTFLIGKHGDADLMSDFARKNGGTFYDGRKVPFYAGRLSLCSLGRMALLVIASFSGARKLVLDGFDGDDLEACSSTIRDPTLPLRIGDSVFADWKHLWQKLRKRFHAALMKPDAPGESVHLEGQTLTGTELRSVLFQLGCVDEKVADLDLGHGELTFQQFGTLLLKNGLFPYSCENDEEFTRVHSGNFSQQPYALQR